MTMHVRGCFEAVTGIPSGGGGSLARAAGIAREQVIR